ncbi:hypothetical protein CAOG_02006 [Capsaspora owczarzaki ATCC 30864]|uniref:PA14 domain-containing protein n=1 Tax=Capsaspora owczarzaki (strain ATCC 30864) TaxID=595528 RepID=A0A0D2VKZ2_CAPO3|nr:hypothetical protein CAOG_02006 [Capsaspora owczarzaki ATCC 30864]KJE90747.1 hypothetical protein CAOG_002006 [Capsaspora owczarzaki ATCC 30864]|eukprot:XP_004348756.1 hypothetical protein CAOG_02006 [Capsaspora owczarzaki ATCC 30864]
MTASLDARSGRLSLAAVAVVATLLLAAVVCPSSAAPLGRRTPLTARLDRTDGLVGRAAQSGDWIASLNLRTDANSQQQCNPLESGHVARLAGFGSLVGLRTFDNCRMTERLHATPTATHEHSIEIAAMAAQEQQSDSIELAFAVTLPAGAHPRMLRRGISAKPRLVFGHPQFLTASYDGLAAFDANNHSLPTDMTCASAADPSMRGDIYCRGVSFLLIITVNNAASAAFPILVDPIVATGYPVGVLNDANLYWSYTAPADAQCVFPFTYNSISRSTCISDGTRFNFCGTTANLDANPLAWRTCDQAAVGFTVGIGQLGSTATGYNDVVWGAPGSNGNIGAVQWSKNTNGVLSATPASLTSSGTCASSAGAHYGATLAIQLQSSGATSSRLIFGSSNCADTTVFTGGSSAPSRVNTYNYKAWAYGVGTMDVAGTNPNFVVSHSSGSPITTFGNGVSGYTRGAAPFNVYADGRFTANMLVADTKAFANNAGLVGYVSCSSSSSCSNQWSATIDQIDSGWGNALLLADINADSYPDAIIGAPQYTSFNGARRNAGMIRLYLGTGSSSLETAPAWTVYGTASGDQYGYTLTNLYDINGDGAHDIAVGAPYSNSEKGAIYIYLGYWDNSVTRLSGLRLHQTIIGAAAGHLLGFSMAGGRDLNNDGIPDMVIGMPKYNNGRTDWAGRVAAVLSKPYTDVNVNIRNNLFLANINTSMTTPLIIQTTIANAGLRETGPITLTISIPDATVFGAPTVLPEYGLTAYYYNSQISMGNFAGQTPVLQRNEDTVSFNLGTGSPDATVNVDYFSARYVGYIVPSKTASDYRFTLVADDNARVYVSNTAIVSSTGGSSTSNALSLTAGVQYPFVVEYNEAAGASSLVVTWSSSSAGILANTLLPTENLRPSVQTRTITCTDLTCTVQMNSLVPARSCWACQSNPAGTQQFIQLQYTMDQTRNYPATATWTAVNQVTPVVFGQVTAVHSLNFFTFADLRMNAVRAFVPQADPNYATNPTCSNVATSVCSIPSGSTTLVLRNIGFVNNGPATAFAVSLLISFPTSVEFLRVQRISDKTTNNASISGFSCSRVDAGVSCLFSNLNSGSSFSIPNYEIVFSIANLRVAGNWQFKTLLSTLSAITTPALAAGVSNLLNAPDATANLGLANPRVSAGSYCAANQVCAGTAYQVSFDIQNTGAFGSARPQLVIAPPTAFAASASYSALPIRPRISQDGQTLDCNVGPGSNYTCFFPQANIAAASTAAVQLMLTLSANTPVGTELKFAAVISGNATESTLADNALQFSYTSCRNSTFVVTMSTSATSIYPSNSLTVLASVNNRGPSDYDDAAAQTMVVTLPSGVDVLSKSDVACTGGSNVQTCPIPDLANGFSGFKSFTIRLTNSVIPGGVYTTTLTSTATAGTSSASTSTNVVDDTNLQVLINAAESSLFIGSPQLFTVGVQNNHPVNNATNVQLVVFLPVSVALDSGNPIQIASGAYAGMYSTYCTNQVVAGSDPNQHIKITCTFPEVTVLQAGCSVGSSQKCQVILTIPTLAVDAGDAVSISSFTTTASVTGQKPDQGNAKTASISFSIYRFPDLVVSMSPVSSVAVHEKFAVDAVFLNQGQIAATNVSFTLVISQLSGTVNLQAVTQSLDACDSHSFTTYEVTCNMTSLAPAQSVAIQLQYNTLGAANGVFSTFARVQSATNEIDTDNNQAALSTTILDTYTDLAIDSRPSPYQLQNGDNVTFTFTVLNYGVSTARNLVVSTTSWPYQFLPSTSVTQKPSYCTFSNSDRNLNCDLGAGGLILDPGYSTLYGTVGSSISFTMTCQVNVIPSFLKTFRASADVFQLNITMTAEDTVIPNLATSTSNVQTFNVFVIPPAPVPAKSESGMDEKYQILIAVLCSIAGAVIIGLVAKKLGFFDRKPKPPTLDEDEFMQQQNPQHDD